MGLIKGWRAGKTHAMTIDRESILCARAKDCSVALFALGWITLVIGVLIMITFSLGSDTTSVDHNVKVVTLLVVAAVTLVVTLFVWSAGAALTMLRLIAEKQ